MFKKVKALEYAQKNMFDFKKYKNMEKLKIVSETSAPTKSKLPYKYFICVNQHGKELVMSDFMLEFGYSKSSKGVYTPKEYKIVNAFAVKQDINFIGSEGEEFNLRAGDYFVICRKKMYGVKKEAFEENYEKYSRAIKMAKIDLLNY